MTTLLVETAGMSSVQDGGRSGLQRYGIAPAGAMDRAALAAANALVSNAPTAAAVEIGPLGAEFRATDGDALLAVAGAERTIDVEGERISTHCTFLLRDGDSVRIGAARSGVFSYLAPAGQIACSGLRGSCAVLESAGLGDPFPRRLQPGDALQLGRAAWPSRQRRLAIPRQSRRPIRVIAGPQLDQLPADAFQRFLAADWRIAAASDRMAYRLDGPFEAIETHTIISDANVHGSIQIAGSGQPLVLMADRGTIGGYPRVATIISADLGRFAQLPAGHAVRFAEVDIVAAQAAARRHAAEIAALATAVTTTVAELPPLEALLAANLAGAAVNALDDPAIAAAGRGVWGSQAFEVWG